MDASASFLAQRTALADLICNVSPACPNPLVALVCICCFSRESFTNIAAQFPAPLQNEIARVSPFVVPACQCACLAEGAQVTRAGKGAGWATSPEAEDLLAASLRLARQPQAASRAPGTCRHAQVGARAGSPCASSASSEGESASSEWSEWRAQQVV